MSIRTQVLAMGAIAMLLLATGAGAVTASRALLIERTGERGETITASAARLTFAGTELSRGLQVICNVTLLSTLRPFIAKRAGAMLGHVHGFAVDRGERCTHGELIESVRGVVPLRERGSAGTSREIGGGVLLYNVTGGRSELWKLVYDSFGGTLPEITTVSFHVEGAQVRLDLRAPLFGSIECLYRGSLFGQISIERRLTTGARAVLASTRLARDSGAALCPETGTVAGSFTLPRLTVTLPTRLVNAQEEPITLFAGQLEVAHTMTNPLNVPATYREARNEIEGRYRAAFGPECAAAQPPGRTRCRLTVSRAELGIRELGAISYRVEIFEALFIETFAVQGF